MAKLNIKGRAVKEPSEVYHANPALSASKVRTILRSPLHFKTQYIDGVVELPTPAQRFGTLAHTALLEPRRFLDNYVLMPEFKGTGSRDAKQRWLDGLPEAALVMNKDEADAIVGMIKSVQEHPGAARLMRGGIAEHSLYFTESQTGISGKFRPDYLTEDGYIVDLKTTTDASRLAFMRSIANYGYHVSVGFYSVGFKAVFGQLPKGYVFIAIEKTPPYATAVYVADDTIVEKGTAEAMNGIWRFKNCSETNRWPGYQDEIENISLPAWMLYD